MDISTILENKVFFGIIAALLGAFLTVITQYFLNKRGVFTYNVFHNRVGLSTDDPIYGSVKVTWNDTPVRHLYLSTIELTNSSLKDYESVVVRVFTTDTKLLTQRTEIANTTQLIDFTKEYKEKIEVKKGKTPTESQFNLFRGQRDYFIPTMNRGQVLRFDFLNAAISDGQPNLWLEVLHKGVKCKYKVAQRLVFGVPQPLAATVGTIVCATLIALIVPYFNSIHVASTISFILGLIVLIPGAYSIRFLRLIRDWLGG